MRIPTQRQKKRNLGREEGFIGHKSKSAAVEMKNGEFYLLIIVSMIGIHPSQHLFQILPLATMLGDNST